MYISEVEAEADKEAARNGVVRCAASTAGLGRREGQGQDFSSELYIVRLDAERR